MLLKKNIFILLVFYSLTTKAQFLDTIKSITQKKPSIDARIETRNSFIENKRAKVTGLRLGLTFQKKLKIGIGYSWLASEVYDKKIISTLNGSNDTVNNFLKMGYAALYTDFVFHKTKRWQLSVPLQWGMGITWFNYNDGAQSITNNKQFLLLYEPGISVQFKIFKWLGLGTDIGYRFTVQKNQFISNRLNSPTYAFKLLIWFDQLYYLSFPKSRITTKFGPSEW